jgi:DNA-binding transcriptional regulator of glucitol operon
MEFTQTALLMLLLFWVLQIAGSWIQWKHYRAALGDASQRWSDGFLGMGQSRPRFGAGAVVMLEVDPELRVRRLQALTGISVFARFESDESVRGWSLSQLAERHAPGPRDTPLARAVRQAITQVEEVRQRKS